MLPPPFALAVNACRLSIETEINNNATAAMVKVLYVMVVIQFIDLCIFRV